MAIGRNMSVSPSSHLLQFCLKSTTNHICCHNWMTDLSSYAVIVYCTWNDCLTMSKTKIYCNATLGDETWEERRVRAKIVKLCKHLDGAYLDVLLKLQHTSVPFSFSAFTARCAFSIYAEMEKQTCLTGMLLSYVDSHHQADLAAINTI